MRLFIMGGAEVGVAGIAQLHPTPVLLSAIMSCGGCLKCGAVLVVVAALFVSGVQLWLTKKGYVFSAQEVADITTDVLRNSTDQGHNAIFRQVEAKLRNQYEGHILPPSQTEWIFMNAGGWMGAMYILHASLTEYVLFFGTAIDSSGHSGRYWANVSDTVVSGTHRIWKEGTTEATLYYKGDTSMHAVGEAAAVQWSADTWMVEYGRGFVPSTLGFALSDTLFSTQDFYVLYKVFRVYSVALVQEILQGNF